MINKLNKLSILFVIGGLAYVLIEIIYRGYSHPSMFLVGGLCFVLIGELNERVYTWEMALVSQMFISSIIVTILEFISGLILNVWLGLGVWDYSSQPYNLLGQICLLFFNLWFLLSIVGIVLDDFLRYKLFREPIHKYKIL
jgi:uncharacterized membrane protein